MAIHSKYNTEQRKIARRIWYFTDKLRDLQERWRKLDNEEMLYLRR